MIKMNQDFKPKLINVGSRTHLCQSTEDQGITRIYFWTIGVVWYFLYFEQLGVLCMFYWLSYTKHMIINKATMDIMINLIQMLLIFVFAIRPRDCLQKWQWRHDGFYNYLPFLAWPMIGTLQCRRLSHCSGMGAPSTISVPPFILRIVHRFKGEDSNIGIDGVRSASRHLFVYVTCVWFLWNKVEKNNK